MTETKSKEMWKEHELGVKNMRKRRCYKFRTSVVPEFRNLGFEVVEISQHQYRINDALDIFPANKTFQDRKTRVNGRVAGDFRSFIRQFFEIK